MRLVLTLPVVVAVACAADPTPITNCTPGVQTPCACPGGAQGAQRCAADGSGYGVCECPDAAAPVDVVAVADGVDVQLVPDLVTVDRPDVVAVADVPRDVPAADRVMPVDAAPAPDAATDAPVAPVDVPPGECADPERSCSRDTDCAMCSAVRGLPWCCGARGRCTVVDTNGRCEGRVPTPTMACDNTRRCRFQADCDVCMPAMGSPWCCGRSGACGVAVGMTTCP